MSQNPVRFYLVRHGQTWSNLRRMMIGGGGSAPLTVKGREAAKHLGLGLCDVHFTAAYASPLGRAVETGELILRSIANAPRLLESEGLKDVFWGELEGGVPDDVHALRTAHPDDPLFPMGKIDAPDYKTIYGGESIADFLRRFEQSLHDIAASHPEGGNILVVSHAALGSFLAKHGAPIDQMDTANISTLPEVANTSVSLVVLENGAFRVERINDLSYIHNGEKLAAESAPLTLFLFSDPETLYDAKGLLLGCADSRLSKNAIEKAKQLREQFKTQPFAAVYTSPLGRAKEWCARIIDTTAQPPFVRDNLREIKLTLWEAEKKTVLAKKFPSEYAAVAGGGDPLLHYESPVGAESGAAAANRLDSCLREIGEKHEFSGGAVAVFTHKMALDAWLALNKQKLSADKGTLLQFAYQHEEFLPVGENK